MKFLNLLLFALVFPFVLNAQKTVDIIPLPLELEIKQGNFIIDKKTSLSFDKNNKELKAVADLFSQQINALSGIKLQQSNSLEGKVISFTIQSLQDLGKEGYVLDVKKDKITVKANSSTGIFMPFNLLSKHFLPSEQIRSCGYLVWK